MNVSIGCSPLQVAHGTPEFTEDARVELSFETSEVRAVCIGREAAVGALGDAAAKDLAARLSEAEASANFDDLKLLLDTQLELCADGTYRLALSTGWVICGRPGGVAFEMYELARALLPVTDRIFHDLHPDLEFVPEVAEPPI